MPKVLVIDTETGGLDPAVHSLLSLGAVVWQDGRVVDTLELFVAEPEPVVEQEALAINALDLGWLSQHGRSPREAAHAFLCFLEKNFGDLSPREKVCVAGHNVHFDMAFLKRLYRLADCRFPALLPHRYLDTAAVVQFLSLAGKLPLLGAGSEETIRYFGIEFEGGKRHTALGDALATAKLLNRLLVVIRG